MEELSEQIDVILEPDMLTCLDKMLFTDTPEFRVVPEEVGEAALVRRFGVSRITVGRALRELRHAGLIDRRAGSGTYLATIGSDDGGLLFGLLIPNLAGTEIFPPICRECQRLRGPGKMFCFGPILRQIPQRKASKRGNSANNISRKKLSEFSLLPLKRMAESDQINQRIISGLDRARIPVVLLDRCFLAYPNRSRHDLIEIDHRRAGYMITEHLLKLGCRRIALSLIPTLHRPWQRVAG